MEAVLGETQFSVVDEKVSILELRVHAISGLALNLQPSPGNSHTMVAKATGLQTLSTPKQVYTLIVFFRNNLYLFCFLSAVFNPVVYHLIKMSLLVKK